MNPTGGTIGDTPIGHEEYMKRQNILNKPWAESTVEEKLEKVSEELIQLGYNTHRVSNLEVEVAKLKKHDHKDGKIVVPLESTDAYLSAGGLARRNNLA